MLHHDGQELDGDLGARSEEDLSLAAPLGVGDGTQGVVEDAHKNHGC